jgi:membrane protein YdbS with pleckstrin-like domain
MNTSMTTTLPNEVDYPASGVMAGERRPAPTLMKYYFLVSIIAGPGILFLLPYRFFRYKTLRYDFDAQGVTVRWGILFRREITLTYARIQDIHLVSNVVERWLGLGRVQIQTASAQSGAEMTIEGLPDYEKVRDELYRRMRGARGAKSLPRETDDVQTEIVNALHAATSELRALRAELERRNA